MIRRVSVLVLVLMLLLSIVAHASPDKLEFIYENGLPYLKYSGEGTVLFSWKVDGKYQVYPEVRTYDGDGKRLSTEKNVPLFTDDYSTWFRWDRATKSIADLDDSEYGEDIHIGGIYTQLPRDISLSKEKAGSTPLFIDQVMGTKYTILAVIDYGDGEYSEVKEFNFTAKRESTTSPPPSLSVQTVKSTDDYRSLKITAKAPSGHALLSFSVLKEGVDESADTIYSKHFYNGETTYSYDFTIEHNGKYGFRVEDSNGGWRQEVLDVKNLSGLGKEGNNIKDPVDQDFEDTVAPKLTVSGIPKSINFGDSFELVVKSDKKVTMQLNGVEFVDTLEGKFEIWGNGDYLILASDINGNVTEELVKVTAFVGQGADEGWSIDPNDREGNAKTVNGDEVLPQTGGILQLSIAFLGAVLLFIGGQLYIRRCIIKSQEG